MTFRNLSQMQRLQAERFGPAVALRHRRLGLFRDVTWRQYREMTEACALALIDAGVGVGDRVGLVAENRLEWLIADMAIAVAGAVNVPPHAPLTARQIQFQLAETEVRWLFVSTAEQLHKIRQIADALPDLAGMVIFDGAAGGPVTTTVPIVADKRDACRYEPPLLSWEGFLQHGRACREKHGAELARREAALSRDDLATIMYTSGTTGNPKGVMLTHGNLLSNAQSMIDASPRTGGVCLNWLPFSHIYARTCDHYVCQLVPLPLCLADSQETLVRDLGETQPAYLSSVPRFYEKVLSVVADADPARTGKRLRDVFGKSIEWLGSGGAPLPPPVAEAYRAAGLLLLQGYGLTESSPVIAFNRMDCFDIASVGPALPGVEIKIAADGEVLCRGPNVMKGYWKNPAATALAIRDGWLHTGDLGRLAGDEKFLFITGRKKELIVLSSGKKVAPAEVEGLLLSDPCFDQAMVHGDNRHFLSALVVPNWHQVCECLELPDDDPERLAKLPTVRTFLEQRIESALVNLSPWEHIKSFVIVARPFSVDREELTVSLKMRRDVITSHHRDELDALYAM